MARERAERNSEIEGRPSLMLVRLSTTSENIEEDDAMEGLSRDGETEKESEKGEMETNIEEKEETMLDNRLTSGGRASVGRQSPKAPTKPEKEERSGTHCPCRSWCLHCVKSRARNAPHRTCVEVDPLEEGIIPIIHMGHFFDGPRRRKGFK